MADILLVEDDDDLRQDLAFLIRQRGFPVVTAVNGQDALDKLRTSAPPCLILLDLMMPIMDGWALRGELLRTPALAEVPVVVISGRMDVDRDARSLRAVGWLTKPIDLDRLYELVATHC
jgi:CheY-like chemotaxis protein